MKFFEYFDFNFKQSKQKSYLSLINKNDKFYFVNCNITKIGRTDLLMLWIQNEMFCSSLQSLSMLSLMRGHDKRNKGYVKGTFGTLYFRTINQLSNHTKMVMQFFSLGFHNFLWFPYSRLGTSNNNTTNVWRNKENLKDTLNIKYWNRNTFQ